MTQTISLYTVCGCNFLISLLIRTICRIPQMSSDEPNFKCMACNGLLHLVLFVFSICWLIVGAVHVFGTSPTYDDPNDVDYCDHTTYWFAFVMIIIGLVFVGVFVLVGCCMCICCVGMAAKFMSAAKVDMPRRGSGEGGDNDDGGEGGGGAGAGDTSESGSVDRY